MKANTKIKNRYDGFKTIGETRGERFRRSPAWSYPVLFLMVFIPSVIGGVLVCPILLIGLSYLFSAKSFAFFLAEHFVVAASIGASVGGVVGLVIGGKWLFEARMTENNKKPQNLSEDLSR